MKDSPNKKASIKEMLARVQITQEDRNWLKGSAQELCNSLKQVKD